MSIRLINLDRSPARLAEFQELNGHLENVSRFSAIDGKTVHRHALVERGLIEANIPYTDGAVGVALSHLLLWEETVERNEYQTICEDDAVVHKNFAPASASLIASLPPDWHLVMWGWNFDSYLTLDMIPGVSPALMQFDQAQMRAGARDFQSAPLSPQLFRLHRAFGIVCYSISPLGAGLLREACVPLRHMSVFFPGLNRMMVNNGIDIVMNDLYPKTNSFVSFPPLVITKNDHSISTVQTG